MPTVSLCLIVKDEEASLPKCLSTVSHLVEEIIVVDTGSTDATKAVAAEYGARVFDFAWIDDFSAARNFAFGQATQTFILWLDADDVLEEIDQAKLLSLKEQADWPYDSITMNYHLGFDEQNRPTYSLKRNRLVRRECGFRWIGAVHEYLEVFGRIFHSDIAVTHRKERAYSDRNLQIYRRRRERGEAFSPRDQYYFGNELYDHGLHAEAADQYELFLNGGLGWSQDLIAACSKLAHCRAVLGESEKQLQALLRALGYEIPQAEICCKLGEYYAGNGKDQQAIYWYRQATLLEEPLDAMYIKDRTAWTWLPHIQLTYLYDKTGNLASARFHHGISKSMKPDHPSVLHNESYFAGLDRVHAE